MDQPNRKRNDPRRDRTRAKLLEIGLEAFIEKPYEDVSVADIVAKANVSYGLVYHHFGSKRQFYLASLHAYSNRMRSVLAPESSLGPRARLENLVLGYLRFAGSHSGGFRSVASEVSEDARSLIEADRMDAVADLIDNVAEISDPGPLLVLGVRAWLGFVETATMYWLDQPDPVDEGPLVQLLSDGFEFVVSHERTCERVANAVSSGETPFIPRREA